MALLFSPPSSTSESKPHIKPWIPPRPTSQMDLEWAELRTIDLSLLDSPDGEVVRRLIEDTKSAIREDGFLFLDGYGVSLEQLHRQFTIAQYLHESIGEEEKERLLWNPEMGSFAGFKRRWGWKVRSP